MALITRRYIKNTIRPSDIADVIQSTAQVVASNAVFADIQVDDSDPGYDTGSDQVMESLGYSFLGENPGGSIQNVSLVGLFQPASVFLPTLNPATSIVRSEVPLVSFLPAVDEVALWKATVPIAYGGGDLTVEIDWLASVGIVAGDVEWGASFKNLGNNISQPYSGETTVVTTTPGVNGDTVRSTLTLAIPFTSAALEPGNSFMFRIRRLGTSISDTMLGNAEILQVRLTGPA